MTKDNITIQDLARVLSEGRNIEINVSEQFVLVMFDVVMTALERERLVKIKGLGTFKVIEVGARESINVNTGERVVIGSHRKVTFSPDSIMKELVNKPFSQFETVVLNDGVEFDDMVGGNVESVSEPDVATLDDYAETGEPDGAVIPDMYDFTQGRPEEPLLESVEKGTPGQEFRPEDLAYGKYGMEEAASESDSKEKDTIPEPEFEPIGETDAEESDVGYSTDGDFVDNENVALQQMEPEAEGVCMLESESVPEDTAAEPSVEEEQPEAPSLQGRGIVKKVLLGLSVVVLVVAAAYCGFLYGLHVAGNVPQMVIDRPKIERNPQKPSAQPVVVKQDSTERVKQATPPVAADSVQKKETGSTAKPDVEKKESVQNNSEAGNIKEFDSSKYDRMDSRVRTGAYRIVGTSQVVSAREGETLVQISDRLLGTGMECYVEVYNDLKSGVDLKTGQKVRIPKLELKKKRKH